jgi:hypothetical protein
MILFAKKSLTFLALCFKFLETIGYEFLIFALTRLLVVLLQV